MRSFAIGAAASLAALVATAADRDSRFEPVFIAGERDSAGRFVGGTEMRNLVVHQGRLFAGNGYWEDRPGSEGLQHAQILVLDGSRGAWRAEPALEQWQHNNRPRNLAVSALTSVTFTTALDGSALSPTTSLLLAGAWDLAGFSQVFVRAGGENGRWAATPLPVERVPIPQIQQVRAIVQHRDRVTGVDLVFAGNDPHGIFAGGYDASAPGAIRWIGTPELAIASIKAPAASGLDRLRVASFAECGDTLYATVGHQIYRRRDGSSPSWELLYTNARPGHSETGLRGLTALADTGTSCDALLVAVEGSAARILRIDARDGSEQEELNISAFLGAAWRTRVSYVIAGYNDMTVLPGAGGAHVLIGIEAFLPPGAPVPEGHNRVGGLEGGGWYLVRRPDRRYDLRLIAHRHPATGYPLIAVRAIAVSPFPDEPDMLYFAGYDANKQAAHNTAWIMRAPRAVALGESQSR